MKLDSEFFDSIRIKPDDKRARAKQHPGCQWRGCREAGLYRAPKGRGREGEYFHLCLDHVRQYNKSYNYFNGMTDEEIVDFQESALTGHRPTWDMGVNAWARGKDGGAGRSRGDEAGGTAGSAPPGSAAPGGFRHGFAAEDPHGLFSRAGGSGERAPQGPRRPIRKLERRCLRALNLDDHASAEEIKLRYKELVKRHHPDTSGGQGSEDKLREVIQAYKYLKEVGLA